MSRALQVTEDGKQGIITVTLKYVEGGVPAIKGLQDESPSRVSASIPTQQSCRRS